jgi:hypothetical protein
MTWGQAFRFKHESYDMLGTRYGILKETCSPKELLDGAMSDTNILGRKRCSPLNQYYSMIMIDTLGYVPAPDWSAQDHKTPGGKHKDVVNPKYLEHRPKSTSTNIQPPTGNYNSSSGVYNEWGYKVSQDNTTSSGPSNLQVLEKSTSAYLDTDKVSEKRFSNMQRKLKSGKRGPSLVGETNEGSSEGGGNEHEERDNALYDDRMVESERKNLKDWKYQIKRIKQNDLPDHFIKQREKDLDNAQADFVESKKRPVYLEGVKPPWNQGTGQAIIRYNEMIIRRLENRIEKSRERNANNCVLEDAAKRTDGPRGRGNR